VSCRAWIPDNFLLGLEKKQIILRARGEG
jgi:hypothetical protein